MPTRSKKPGKSTDARVQSISPDGLWLLVGRKEYFLRHKDFPWFKGARVSDVLNLLLPSPEHLYWPALDVDLHLDSLEHPGQYPVRFKPGPPKPAKVAPMPRRREALVAAGSR